MNNVNSIISKDVLLNMLMGLMALVMLSNFEIPKEKKEELTPPGNVIATITWEQGPHDVDLWLEAPGEKKPVGYSNKDGGIWNLLRDDLGISTSDITGMNYENAFSRGTPEGEYVVNLHAYNVKKFPLQVNVEVIVNKLTGGSTTKVFSQTLTLDKAGEEITAVRFKLDKNGNLVPNSVHRIFKALRNGEK